MKNNKIRKMVGVALLIAVMIVLQSIGAHFPIKVSGVDLSFVLIPIVIGAAVYGPAAGAVLGGVFGALSVFYCVNGMDLGGHAVFQASPLLCTLVVMAKGILCGTVSGWVYKLLKRKDTYVAMLCAAIACPVVNTGIFLIGMFSFFTDVLNDWAEGGNIVIYVLSMIVLRNFLPELAINVALSPVSQRIINTVTKK